MSYKGSVLRGEKWFYLGVKEPSESQANDIQIYQESCEKVKKEEEAKSKGKK